MKGEPMNFQEFCRKYRLNPAKIAGFSGLHTETLKELVAGTYPSTPQIRTIESIAKAINELLKGQLEKPISEDEVVDLIAESKKRLDKHANNSPG